MRSANALAAASTHNDPGVAVAEAVGEIIDQLGPSPDLALLFVSGAFVTQVKDLVHAVNEILKPGTLLGSTAISVVSGEKEVEDQTAISMFAGNFNGYATPIRLGEGVRLDGWETARIRFDLPPPFLFWRTVSEPNRLSVRGGHGRFQIIMGFSRECPR